MTNQDRRVVQQRIGEICRYRQALTRMVKHPVTLEQAITDWFDRGYHLRPYHSGMEDLAG